MLDGDALALELREMGPLVSIVVPTYAREQVLCHTLMCLVQQDYSHSEILVVDQSRQHEPATVAFLASVRNRIRLIKLPQPNPSAARNHGIRMSTGEIVVCFDDDFHIPKDTISKLVSTYTDLQVGGVCGIVIHPNQTEQAARAEYAQKLRIGTLDDAANLQDKIKIADMIGGFMSFRKEVFERVGMFDVWLGMQPIVSGEDYDMSRRAVLSGYSLYLNPSIVTWHLSATEGGTGRIARRPSDLVLAHLNAFLYVLFKTPAYPGPLGWVDSVLRGYRSFIAARPILAPAHKWKHRIFFRAVQSASRNSRANRRAARTSNGLESAMASVYSQTDFRG
jgi:GT2 family glycosyltransferase